MLKIDRCFISKMKDSKKDLAIVEAINNMAKILDLEVVAEGIESQGILKELLILGSATGQDYFWNKPMNQDAFVKHLFQSKSIVR